MQWLLSFWNLVLGVSALGVLGLGLAVWRSQRLHRRVRLPWREAARRLGMVSPRALGPAGLKLSGACDGLGVGVDTVRSGGRQRTTCTRFVVRGTALPHGFSARAKGRLSEVRDALGFPDVQVGDELFDDLVQLGGAESEVLAVLDAESRRVLVDFIAAGRARIVDGEARVEVPGLVDDADALVGRVRELVGLVQKLSCSRASIPERLAVNAVEDAVPGVRRHNLERLLNGYPNHPAARRACERVLDAAEDAALLRLAAHHVGGAGLLRLAEVLAAEGTSEEIRAAALEHWIHYGPEGRLVPILESVLAADRPAFWAPAARALGKFRHRPALEAMLRRLPEADPAATLAIAEALGKIGDSCAEPALLPLLEHAAPNVREAAAVALGNVGTVRAVESLLACARATPLLGGGDLRERARSAARAIQERLGEDAGAGQLTLTDAPGDAGALSLDRSEGGLAVVAEPAAAGGETGAVPAPAPASAEATAAATATATEPANASGPEETTPAPDTTAKAERTSASS
ncbi:MAG: HEAT repeat domain-containing protein [Planctomycetes bacterium]|nr:HEAT repeat domain-containing protein [Planctomycetota bacterium]